MSVTTTQDLYLDELGDIYDAEHRFLKGQQQMVQQASDPQLKSAIQLHIEQTQQQIANLDQVFQLLGQQPKGATCNAAQGLVTEAQKTMGEAGTDAIRDCSIDGAVAKVEHYEIASYRGLIAGAQVMGKQDIVSLLRQNLDQEEQTAQKAEQSMPQLLQKAMQQTGVQG
jgi:ferritin-like metal-binding protein YciE